MKNLFKIYRQLPQVHRYVYGTAVFSLLYAVFMAFNPLIFKYLIDAIAHAKNSAQFLASGWWLFGLLIGSTLLKVAFDTLAWWQGEKLFNSTVRQLRRLTYTKMSTKDIHYFESAKSGEIIAKATAGINHFTNWINTMLWNFFPATSILLVTGILMFAKIGWTTVIALTVIPLVVYFFRRAAKLSKPILKLSNKNGDLATAYMTEGFASATTVRSLSAEAFFEHRHDHHNDKAYQHYEKYMRIWGYHIFIRESLAQTILLVPIIFIIIGAANLSYSYGDIIYIALLLQQFGSNVWSIGRVVNQTTTAEVRAKLFNEIIDHPTEVVDTPGAIKLDELKSIEFVDVSFTYPDSQRGAIHNISFRVEPAQTLALVGPSGTGKSTITKLLLRFYHPTSGQILINGQDADRYTAESIRAHIGLVMQDVALFNTTLKENIQLANVRANSEEIEQAARQAHADEFIKTLPKQYKTLVGERGIKLSGGQRQRIAIARAIIKNPQLIILDEATSALDSESERLVQAGLAQLMQSRSAIVIAHRLSTIKHADQILVLKNGRVHELGRHDDLIKRDGLYAKLTRLQSATGKIEL